MENIDILRDNIVYPDVDNLFELSVQPVDSIKDSCIFVIDTNVLLLPYGTSSQSILEMKKVYKKLIDENRFIIPGQVVREFAKNRPEKIKEVFQQLSDKRSSLKKLNLGNYPLLNEMPCYSQAAETEQCINKLIDDYHRQIGQIIEAVRSWSWNDPVSSIYKDLFTSDLVFDPEIDIDYVKNELSRRYTNRIPPGFKDGGKQDAGIGDLLIWHTILEVGKNKKRDIVFVSGEKKTDWFYRSGSQNLYTRFELVYEFSQCSCEKTFHIIDLSELLKLFKAEESIIKEVKSAEKTASYIMTD